LLDMQEFGLLSFLLASVLAFRFRRLAAAVGLLACVVCVPLYLLFVAQVPSRRLGGGKWKVPLSANFAWD
jgi:hypothetical protein